ncbi:MAG TPA: YetF domain-containing protein [Paucimonas sp.]|nr:YetF domain-containing protein [Paucimonas sp.]
MNVDWSELFSLQLPVAEIVIRGTVMYWFLFAIFRFVIRRDIGAVGIADILILVIVADAAQNGMSGEYKSITDGVLLVATLIFWNVAFDWLSFRSPAFRRFAEPSSLPLVKDGRLVRRNLRHEFITEDELWARLREHEITSLDEVSAVFLEPDGEFSVIRKKE